MNDGGKGSSPRPIPDYKEYEKNWDRIFGRDKDDSTQEKDREESTDKPDSGGSK